MTSEVLGTGMDFGRTGGFCLSCGPVYGEGGRRTVGG